MRTEMSCLAAASEFQPPVEDLSSIQALSGEEVEVEEDAACEMTGLRTLPLPAPPIPPLLEAVIMASTWYRFKVSC